jgi:hypothetical protein
MHRSFPSRLYKYQQLTAQSLAALKVRTIWFGSPSRLNDPFDCAVPWRVKTVTAEDCLRLFAERSEPKWVQIQNDRRYVDASGHPTPLLVQVVENAGRAAFERFAADSYTERGVTCFSEAPDNTLLWSHYGGGHRGMCLEFDTSSPWLSRLHQVRYTDDLTELDVVDCLIGDSYNVLSLLLTKASCWSYEREWRALHKEAGTEYCYGIDALTGVYLGAALTPSEKDLVAHIVHGTTTKLFEVKRSPTSFRLDVQSMTYTPYDVRRPDVV